MGYGHCDFKSALVTVPEVGEPPETVKVPVGVKFMAPVGAIVTGPERFMVVGNGELSAVACMEPLPVRVPPDGPETLKELLFTINEPELPDRKDPLVAFAVKVNKLEVKTPG